MDRESRLRQYLGCPTLVPPVSGSSAVMVAISGVSVARTLHLVATVKGGAIGRVPLGLGSDGLRFSCHARPSRGGADG
jgi:hypothetical protein